VRFKLGAVQGLLSVHERGSTSDLCLLFIASCARQACSFWWWASRPP